MDTEITQVIRSLRQEGKKIVFTNGCFDILHPGHIYLLRQAKSLGDFLCVGLNSDESVKRLKGLNRPVFTAEDRRSMLLALRFVDEVVIFEEDTPERLIVEIRPDVLVKGSEYTLSEIVGADFVRNYGGQVITIPMLAGYSTSELINRLIASLK